MNNQIKHRKLGTEPLVGMYYVSECIKCGWIGSSGELTEDDAQCLQPVGDDHCWGDTDEIGADRLLELMQSGAFDKQAAQHQGDTNPITGDMYRLMEAYRIGEFSAESGSETVEALSVAAFDSVESQGHDADSYMAGYCAALYEQGKPFIGLALKPKHQVEPVKWERMSIMEGGKWWPCDDKEEADAAVLCGWKVRALYAEQPAPVAEVMPFAEKVIAKLQRFEACVSDGQDVDIDRHWFDVLTHLGLLRRVQRSPAYWEITQQGEDALKTTHCNSPQ